VILMDLHMPGLNGVEAKRLLREISPNIGILVLTMFEDDESVLAAMRAGARGYLLKGADRGEIGRAIAAVSHGEAIFSASVAQRLMQYFSAAHTSPAEVLRRHGAERGEECDLASITIPPIEFAAAAYRAIAAVVVLLVLALVTRRLARSWSLARHQRRRVIIVGLLTAAFQLLFLAAVRADIDAAVAVLPRCRATLRGLLPALLWPWLISSRTSRAM
jgi:CheY-like chemotaxis protein